MSHVKSDEIRAALPKTARKATRLTLVFVVQRVCTIKKKNFVLFPYWHQLNHGQIPNDVQLPELYVTLIFAMTDVGCLSKVFRDAHPVHLTFQNKSPVINLPPDSCFCFHLYKFMLREYENTSPVLLETDPEKNLNLM